ncbi:MAG: response regulator [Candidatus Shapirobacteria bacterium]
MKKILFIEDESQLVEAYRDKFSKIYEVNFAIDSASAIEKAKEWKSDLIVLDILIPGELNGIGVLKELKAMEETKLIPVLVLTNLEDQEGVVLSLGAIDCLVKSNTSFETVENKVRSILE